MLIRSQAFNLLDQLIKCLLARDCLQLFGGGILDGDL